MDINAILAAVWTFLNSSIGLTLVVSVVVYLLNALYAKKPLWKKYEGAIISAVRHAEKTIPNDSANKSLAKADEAFRYVLKVFEARKGKNATPAEKHELSEGIRIVHDKIDTTVMNGPDSL